MAFFLAHASPEIEILALTTIFGNGGTDITTANALRLVEAVGKPDIPVLQGAAKPLDTAPGSTAATAWAKATWRLPPCSRPTARPPNSLWSESWRHRGKSPWWPWDR